MVIDTLLDVYGRFEGLGNREAIRFLSPYRRKVLTYSDLLLRVGACSHFLSQIPVGPGDRVLFWGENSPDWIVAFWACLALGAQVVPVDPATSPGVVSRILDEAACKLGFIEPDGRGNNLSIPTVPFGRLERLPLRDAPLPSARSGNIAEVLFTSGTTGTPKGIVHRHRTLAANLRPFAAEFERYRLLAAPFQPVRIMSLLPLSHMFGQAMGLFIPPLLGGSVVLIDSTNPSRVLPSLRSEHISVLATVPRILHQCENALRQRFGEPTSETRFRGLPGIVERWWRNRGLHSYLGWKFWAVISGGAALEPAQERYWANLGFAALQGYGLTEAGPVISVNHPFRSRSGSVGKVLAGQDVRLADDGEILVSGDSVSFEVLDRAGETAAEGERRWFRTGDVGSFDADGNLHFKGRKKDVIVTSDGMNVYPEEVETVLLSLPGIRDAAVVAEKTPSAEVVHAVLIPDEGQESDCSELVAAANRRLEPHQRIRRWSVYPAAELPRTPSTLKLRRSEIREWLSRSAAPPETTPAATVESLLSRLAPQGLDSITPTTRIDTDLGLTSLDRIELLQGLEDLEGTALSESEFARLRTVGDIRDWLTQASDRTGPAEAVSSPSLPMPHWNLSPPFRLFRAAVQRGLILPLYRRYIPTRVMGAGNLPLVRKQPFIVAANHQSHMDTVALLAVLPREFRLAPAVRYERFVEYFDPHSAGAWTRARFGLEYLAACLLFNAFPLPQRTSGIRQTLEFAGDLLDRGFSLLLFPEGKRTLNGELQEFKPGVILMSRELKVPILPIGAHWPHSHPVTVTIGSPFEVDRTEDLDTARQRLEEVFRRLKLPEGRVG